MVIDSKYTKIFKSNGLTRQKYDELYAFAVMLHDHKNNVSEYVNFNLEKYLEYSKLDFLKEMRTRYKDIISSSFDVQLYTQVFNCYQNKFDAIRKHLDFGVQRLTTCNRNETKVDVLNKNLKEYNVAEFFIPYTNNKRMRFEIKFIKAYKGSDVGLKCYDACFIIELGDRLR